MIDAVELARLRGIYESWPHVLAIIDDLEKAELATGVLYKTCENVLAERDAARALLREVKGWLERRGYDTARIAKEIGE